MKHTIKTIMLLVVLMMGATEYIWAAKEYTKDGLTVKVTRLPNDDAGSETVSISGRHVTITFTKGDGYDGIGKVTAESMWNPALAPHRTGMMDDVFYSDNTGATEHQFDIPNTEGCIGASVTVIFKKGTATAITSLSEIEDNGNYQLVADVDGSGWTSISSFTGTLDGNFYKITNLSAPLFTTLGDAADDTAIHGIVKNVIFDNINVSGDDNVGAVCGTATGTARIYNCGILATNSTVKQDKDGYDYISSCSSTISGSGNVGGLVGLLAGSSRVINCFSYANVSGSGGSSVGGIVGNNNVATTSSNLKTMVMNCMFYGEVSGTSIAPIYNGKNIVNKDATGVGNYNYFRLESSYVQPTGVTYNCALGAETRFLQRFEFYRHLLNSHRELAGWWATGTFSKDDMAKWVLEPSQIGTSTPYPILKKPGRYPSVVNIDVNHSDLYEGRDLTVGPKLGTLSVTIQMGSGGAVYAPPTGAGITTSSLTLNITDKDPDHYNFNYYKVQLPYYNDVGTNNYHKASDGFSRVVTGWKIVKINNSTTGTGTYATVADVYYDDSGNLVTPYNFADRNCTNKDLYSVSGRVFNQGAYWDVPEGVTSITIEPYWARCTYLADPNADVVYNQSMDNDNDKRYNVPNVGGGQIYTNGNSYPIAGESQKVFTDKGKAIAKDNSGLFQGVTTTNHTVYDYAVVLVGNYHFVGSLDADKSKPYTVTSIDLDGDNEPDFSYILRFDKRTPVHPVRVDFINIPGLGMAQKSTGGTGTYNFGILQPKYFFESTNTSLFRVTQFEYDAGRDVAEPFIVQGGVFEQWVGGQQTGHKNKITYFHVGGNVWFKEFHRGCHQDKNWTTKHPPVSVTGGDYDEFYLTGLYKAVTTQDDNAECYISGGRFGIVAGTGMEGIGGATNNTNGNITWQISYADIREFYGGGINAKSPVQGNITTIIKGSHVKTFCGGPKFGDMLTGRTVKTTATECEFGTYFGAGYGGNSYSRQTPYNYNDKTNIDWNKWVKGEIRAQSSSTFNGYKRDYKKVSSDVEGIFEGVSTQFSYQFLPMSGNTLNCARLFIDYVMFSLATTHGVTSNLTGCTVTGNFYGGGSLGKVDGDVTSTLTDCTVNGNVFGAGFSASLPTVEVDDMNGFETEPFYYEALGTYRKGVKRPTTTYTWEENSTMTNPVGIDSNKPILYTTENLAKDNLGSVSGNVILNIKGTTTVGMSVYGGGEESVVGGDTFVNVSDGVTIGVQGKGGAEYGNVYGGGKGKIKDEEGKDLEAQEAVIAGLVKGNTNVTIIGTPTIYHNVYGGGAFGSVGDFNYDENYKITSRKTGETDTGKATVNIIGGNIGTTGKDNGMVFGSSRGNDQEMNDLADNVAWVYDTEVNIGNTEENSNPQIKGSVYGGGENGHNYNNAVVNIKKGVIGIDDSGESEDNKDEDGGASYPHRGNVYGGGCGTDTYTFNKGEENEKTLYNPMAGVVNGTTTITMTGGHVVHNVYGAGAMGSVGKYTYDTDGTNTIPDGKAVAFAAGSGLCTINISGGRVGVDGTVGDGNVFGAARGDAASTQEGTAQVNNTSVTVSDGAVIWGSVHGGGEAGDVGIYTTDDATTNTYPDGSGTCNVVMTGGTVHHNVFGAGKGEANSFECKKAMVKETSVTISNGTVKGNVYGGGEIARVEKDTEVEIGVEGASGEEYAPVIEGNVFGAGAGLETHGYSALVRGDSKVTVQGKAKVEHNVYGGGEIATVGRYKVAKAADVAKDDFKENYPGIEIGMPYEASSGGKCTVIIKDNVQIGPDEAKDVSNDAGHVFGAGKGVGPDIYGVYTYDVEDKSTMPRRMIADPGEGQKAAMIWEPAATPGFIWEYYPNQPAYFKYLETLALATATDVTIGNASGSGEVDVKGSVYGGSESGFLQRNTEVKILGGCEIGTTGTTFGNVFGGGRGLVGFDVAGRVKGNASVAISGGTTHGSVFGGGELGFVGKFTTEDHKNYVWQTMEDPTDATKRVPTGLCTVTITGATTTIKGNVFGAGKGEDDTFECEKAMVRETSVSISNGTVKGNVYGGGEVGRVDEKTKVETGVAGASEGAAAPVIVGNIFGAGEGKETHGYSALVRGNTEVVVQGKAKVEKSVYGGGEIAAVGRYGLDSSGMPSTLVSGGECKVTVKDNSTIGPDEGGGVFGAGEGVDPSDATHNYIDFTDATVSTGKPKRMTRYTNATDYPDNAMISATSSPTATTSKKTIWEYCENSNEYIWEYFTTQDGYFDFLQTLALATDTKVSIEGSTTVTGSVYGGSKSGFVQRYTDVKIQGGNILSTGTDAYGNPKDGNVFGGGKGLTGNDAAGRTRGNTAVTIIGGSIANDVYGGAALAKSNTLVAEGVYPTATVNLLGGTIGGDAYGGGLGNATTAADAGNTEVNLNGMPQSEYTSLCESLPDGDDFKTYLSGHFTAVGNYYMVNDDSRGCVVKRVFGANNTNGSPKGDINVHVYATQNKNKAQIETDKTKENLEAGTYGPYDVQAVYGGGNLAAYLPTRDAQDNSSVAHVVIEGCGYTSIETVYGGGNAASAPGTYVEVNSCYEINDAFGGGNGKDDIVVNGETKTNPGAHVGYKPYTYTYTYERDKDKTDAENAAAEEAVRKAAEDEAKAANVYGSGVADVELKGGVVHHAFGGSNSRGNVRIKGEATLNEIDHESCPLCVEEVYGAGNEADQDGLSQINLGCITYLNEIYGGAKNADVNSDVVLTIQSGRFDRVFGGNNIGGCIRGSITVNIEETGCHPIIIGQLYGGGNQAGYSIYGYKQNDSGKWVGRESDDGLEPVPQYTTDNKAKNHPQVNAKSFTSIGEIYGGGFGESAVMVGNPTVNINVCTGDNASIEMKQIEDEDTGLKIESDESDHTGEIITINEGTEDEVKVSIPLHKRGELGAVGNVFGGGNAAKVVGDTNINIGTKKGEDIEFDSLKDNPETTTVNEKKKTVIGADIRGNVFGGGNNAEVTGDTHVTIGKQAE